MMEVSRLSVRLSASADHRVPGTPPIVSVIIPAYNAADTLERAIQSVLRQTMPSFEIVVVDDASTDMTLQIAHRIATEHPRVRVLHNPSNVGPAASRNHAIDHTSGAWIALLDADDMWLPQRLEELVRRGDDWDVISDDLFVIHSTDLEEHKPPEWRFLSFVGLDVSAERQLKVSEFVHYDLAFLQPLIRRKFIDNNRIRYDENQRVAEDFYLYFKCLANGARWHLIPDAYYIYIRGSDTLSTDMSRMAEEHLLRSGELLNAIDFKESEVYQSLRLFHRQWQATAALESVRTRVRNRDLTGLGQLLYEKPSYVRLICWKIARHVVYRRLLPRLRARRKNINGEWHPLEHRISKRAHF